MDSRTAACCRFAAVAASVLLASSAGASKFARCVGEHGEPMFAQRCPVQSPALAPPVHGAAAQPAAVQTARVSATALCARSPQALAQQVQAAIHTRNGVRLSGYALWHGRSSRGVRPDVHELLQLVRDGLADVQLVRRAERLDETDYADPDFRQRRVPAVGMGEGADYALVITEINQQRETLRSSERHFGVTQARGCYWLTFSPAAWLANASRIDLDGPSTTAAALAWDRR
jgi:hypothetical protein